MCHFTSLFIFISNTKVRALVLVSLIELVNLFNAIEVILLNKRQLSHYLFSVYFHSMLICGNECRRTYRFYFCHLRYDSYAYSRYRSLVKTFLSIV